MAGRRIDRALVLTSFHQSPLPTALVLRMAGLPWVVYGHSWGSMVARAMATDDGIELAGLVLGEYRRTVDDEGHPQLTDRETEVLRLVAKGLTAKQCAERLGCSHRTVENHVQNTFTKLHLHNRVELVRFALAHGLEDEAPGAP